MTRYMVIHEMNDESEEHTRPPTRLQELATTLGQPGADPQWITVYTPDLNEDRTISMWEASSADHVRAAIEEYGFLDHLTPKVFAVRQWGPEDVIEADQG